MTNKKNENREIYMAKFCGKCGTRLDENTGLCPNCDSAQLDALNARSNSQEQYQWQNNNSSTPDNFNSPPIKLTRSEKKAKKKADKKAEKARKKADKKAKKAAKKASRTTGQKIRIFLLKLLAILLALIITVSAVTGVLVYFNVVDIPPVSDILETLHIVDSDRKNGKSDNDTAYHPEQENIAYDENETMIYFNNLLIVYTNSDLPEEDIKKLAESVDGEVVGRISGSMNVLQIKVKDSSISELNELAKKLMSFDEVLFADVDFPVQLKENAADSNPWNDDSSKPDNDRGNESKPKGNDWWAEAIGAYSAWEHDNASQSVNVGIIDSGFAVNHNDLSDRINLLSGYGENSEDDHGTHVAGIIGGNNNTEGIRGVADKATLYCVDWSPVTNDNEDSGFVSYLSNGEYLKIIDRMIENGVKVINNSWGNYLFSEIEYTKLLFEDEGSIDAYLIEQLAVHFTGAYDSYVRYVETVARHGAFQAILSISQIIKNGYKDFIIVQSAGNGYDNSGPGVDAKYAGAYCAVTEDVFNILSEDTRKLLLEQGVTYSEVKNRIMIVGAVENSRNKNNDYKMTSFSNYGDTVDICAPGNDIYSTITGNTYQNMSGTSMAAPMVAGSIAYLWSLNPKLSASDVRNYILNNTSCSAYGVGNGSSYTYPMLNVGLAANSVVDDMPETAETSSEQERVTTSDERDIVLVLDSSGSMNGKPIEETKKAATKFVDTILQDNASIGIVNYDDYSTISSPFSNSKSSLESVINALDTGGSTNIEAGLRSAEQMLSQSSAKKKIIVLMSDGEPNLGLVGESLISYADELKEKGIYIYTLGFFESISDKTKAQTLMEKIASEGCHYEVSDADSLVFFFGDIADQINGQKYIYVRIACPVDVSVSFNGETLDSSDTQLNTRTSFGSLTFEQSDTQSDYNSYSSQSDSGGYDDRVKILRLKEGENYDIRIEGTARGRMNYSIGFMDENGEYSDFRKFKNIKIKRNTLIDTVANVSDKTVLNVDEDGDGKYDLTYQAEANGNGKLVDYSYIIYIIAAAAVVLIILVVVLVIRSKLRKHYKKI